MQCFLSGLEGNYLYCVLMIAVEQRVNDSDFRISAAGGLVIGRLVAPQVYYRTIVNIKVIVRLATSGISP